MADWKGTYCIITVFDRKDNTLVDSRKVFMDSNTMSDVFTKYDLLKYSVTINPVTK
jgi:hypothetical protein